MSRNLANRQQNATRSLPSWQSRLVQEREATRRFKELGKEPTKLTVEQREQGTRLIQLERGWSE